MGGPEPGLLLAKIPSGWKMLRGRRIGLDDGAHLELVSGQRPDLALSDQTKEVVESGTHPPKFPSAESPATTPRGAWHQ